MPFDDACQMSKTAFGMPFPVKRSVTLPCMRAGCPPGAGSWIMLPPSSRNGAFGDQKGPRMEEDVGLAPSVNIACAISSTRLEMVILNINDLGKCYLRFESNNVRNSMSFISDWSAGLSDRVDELDSHHPLIWSELNFAREVMDVLNERAKDFTASWVGLGTDGVNAMLGEVGIESRHDDGGIWCLGSMKRFVLLI